MLHAVVIGIDNYEDDKIPNLGCAVADASALAGLLERRLAPIERNVQLLLNEAATLSAISHAIGSELYRSVEEGDVVLIYFAGHGCPERVGPEDKPSRYLLTHDSEYDSISRTAVGMERQIPEWLAGLSLAKVVVIFLDCCFSGAAGGRTLSGPLLALAGLKNLSTEGLVSLRELDLGRGRAIMCACDDDQVALESSELGHGFFTQELLRALTRPRSKSGTVPLTTLYDEISAGVRRETQDEQEPLMTLLLAKHVALPSLA